MCALYVPHITNAEITCPHTKGGTGQYSSGHSASLTAPPTTVTVLYTVAHSPPRGTLCVLAESVALLLLTSKIYRLHIYKSREGCMYIETQMYICVFYVRRTSQTPR